MESYLHKDDVTGVVEASNGVAVKLSASRLVTLILCLLGGNLVSYSHVWWSFGVIFPHLVSYSHI